MSSTPLFDRQVLPNGRSLSRLALGLWRLADAAPHDADATLARIDACLAQGITTFDHADLYGDYRCERLFGDALRARPALRDQIEVVTKTGIMPISSEWPGTRVKHYDTSAAHVRASVGRSLQRLHVEVIDLLLIHRPDPLMDAQALGACLDALVDEGQVRGVGVSNFMPWEVELLQSCMRHPLQTQQIELSLWHTEPLFNGQLAQAQRLRQPLMAWSPLGGGRLGAPGTPLAQRLHELGEAADTEASAVAVAWLLHHPAGVLPVMGTTRLDRIARLGEALRVPMDRQTWFELLALARGTPVA